MSENLFFPVGSTHLLLTESPQSPGPSCSLQPPVPHPRPPPGGTSLCPAEHMHRVFSRKSMKELQLPFNLSEDEPLNYLQSDLLLYLENDNKVPQILETS